MNNDIIYHTNQEANINLGGVMKLLAGATSGLSAGLICNALANTLLNMGVTKSTQINIPGGDVKLLYHYSGAKHEADGVYHEFDFKVILHMNK